jgi:hypothetical protein
MNINVKSFEKKTSKGGKEFMSVHCVEGTMSCWNADLFDMFKSGVTLDALVKEENGFKNIIGVDRQVGTFTVPAEEPKKFGGSMAAMKEASKMKKDSMIIANCLNNATQFGIAGGHTWEQVVANATMAIKQFNED